MSIFTILIFMLLLLWFVKLENKKMIGLKKKGKNIQGVKGLLMFYCWWGADTLLFTAHQRCRQSKEKTELFHLKSGLFRTPKTSLLSLTELSQLLLSLFNSLVSHPHKKILCLLHLYSLPDFAGSKNNSGFLASPSAPPPSLTSSWSAADLPRPDPQVPG